MGSTGARPHGAKWTIEKLWIRLLPFRMDIVNGSQKNWPQLGNWPTNPPTCLCNGDAMRTRAGSVIAIFCDLYQLSSKRLWKRFKRRFRASNKRENTSTQTYTHKRTSTEIPHPCTCPYINVVFGIHTKPNVFTDLLNGSIPPPSRSNSRFWVFLFPARSGSTPLHQMLLIFNDHSLSCAKREAVRDCPLTVVHCTRNRPHQRLTSPRDVRSLQNSLHLRTAEQTWATHYKAARTLQNTPLGIGCH